MPTMRAGVGSDRADQNNSFLTASRSFCCSGAGAGPTSSASTPLPGGVFNSQAPLQEMWVAARSGGFHYKRVGDEWRNTRDDSEFFASLSRYAGEQGGATVSLV